MLIWTFFQYGCPKLRRDRDGKKNVSTLISTVSALMSAKFLRIFLETAIFLKILNYFCLKEDAGLHSKYPNPLYLGMLSANYGGNWPCDSSKNVKKKFIIIIRQTDLTKKI